MLRDYPHPHLSLPLIIQLRAECGHYICIGNIIRNYRTRNHSVRGERWEDLRDAGEEGGHERMRPWVGIIGYRSVDGFKIE